MMASSAAPTITAPPSVVGEKAMSSTSNSSPSDGEKTSMPEGDNVVVSGEDGQPAPFVRTIRGFRWILILVGIYSSMFFYSLDSTITADLVPAIVNDFSSVPMLPWLSVGFVAGAYVAILPFGKLYEKFDPKWLYVGSIVCFLGASALCGAAPNMNAIICGRVFLGVAGSGVYCGLMTLVALSTEDHEKPAYFSITAVVWSVGTVLGPVVGGAFERFNWRWAFYINLIIGGVFMPIYLFVLPSMNPLPKSVTRRQRLENFDFLGTLLMTGFSISLVMAINFGGVLYAWGSGETIALFVVGGVVAIVFGVQQYYAWFTTVKDRIFPTDMLRHKEAVLLGLSTIHSNTAAFVPIFYIPVYFQFTRGDSALEAAVRLLPLILVFSVANLSQGFLMVKFGYYWPWFFMGGALSLVGNVMLYEIDATTSTGYIYGAEVILAIGLGFCNQTAYGVIHGVIPPEFASQGIPWVMLAQYTGVTLALSIAGAVFVNGALDGLRDVLPTFAEAELNDILSGTSSAALRQVPSELRGQVIDVIVQNLRKTSIPAFFGSAVVTLISLCLNKRKLLGAGNSAPMVG
ncbi:major facilitator superfamily transporter [Bombardia bombarda]|uniref:Major facilitator superfamily transporter n=1 Tax=Bombardia bombarda TaxID=252184 RepID=A0AA40CEU6_9PEZI|nr:major facilitator superfamily transporter [Bombardia bombarda]